MELDAERPHAAPMDLSADDRKRFVISLGNSGSSSVPSPRTAISPVLFRFSANHDCYVRDCIKLAHDLGSPICKIFAAWRGITLHDGLATYDDTYGYNQYGFWKGDRRGFVVTSMRELCRVAEDHGIVLAMQNHGPDIVNRYQDVLALIEEVGSPAFKACMDINIEPEAESPSSPRDGDATGALQVHSHLNGEFARRPVARSSWWRAATSIRASGDGKSPIPAMSMRSWRSATTAIWTGSSAIPVENGRPATSITSTTRRRWHSNISRRFAGQRNRSWRQSLPPP